ncbi:MAG: carbon-nitrogen hydrolase family protein [Thiothrix sp.]|nr:carbon-nitrogen hydrolase family protein [Thiothrix sp.]HPE60882.1 carbon-nitrogen hydrolase family protein [Thiolinea sp.]
MLIALLQCEPVTSTAAALAQLEQQARQAALQGAALLVTPEMFLTGYHIGVTAIRTLAQPLDGSLLADVRRIAIKHRIALVTGFPEQDPADPAVIYNSVIFIDAHGNRLAGYRKVHLFGTVDRQQFQAGTRPSPVFEWCGWKVAMAICYDIEFPEPVRASALKGAELLLVPTANMYPFEDVCERMVPVRAQENTLFVAYANYVGREQAFHYCGRSCVCDPFGRDQARAAEAPGLLLARLEPATLVEARQKITYLQDCRPEFC